MSLEHERRFLSGGSAGIALDNNAVKATDGDTERNPAK
jgi:hypothetical protein